MDDATRAELAELRRRAFGPQSDIADDRAAMDRLVELESLVLSEHVFPHPPIQDAAEHPDSGDASDAGGGIPFHDARLWDDGGMPASVALATLEEAAPAPDEEPDPPRARHERGGVALVAAMLAAAAVASIAVTPPAPASVRVVNESSRSAYTFARDADAEVLIRVPLDGWFGADVSPPAPEDVPDFPSSGPIDWAATLGNYYGWQLWIGGASGALQGEQCVLIMRGSIAKGRCVVAELRTQSALVVSIPYLSVEASKRPEGLVPGRRIGFWWYDDDAITVLLGNAPEER